MDQEVTQLKPGWLNFEQIFCFGVVGLISTAIDILLLMLLQAVFQIPIWMANVFSYGAGIGVNFTLNRKWTFQLRTAEGRPRQFLQFCGISLTGLVINTLIVHLLGPVFSSGGMGAAGYLPAKAVAAGIVFMWNYGMNRFWTFGRSFSVSGIYFEDVR